MEYRRLGRSGLQVSALSFGSWVTFGTQLNEDIALASMQAAWDAGVNFFDNAETYEHGQSEILMGKAIKRAGWKRSDLVLSTKIYWGGKGPNDSGLSRKHILEGTEAALARLQVDYVDLVFCHRPDPYTPVEETVRAMSYLVNHGKAFYWGTSQWPAAQIMAAYEIAHREHLVPPTMEQPQYNMLVRERVDGEYLPLFRQIGLGTTIWSPLASGLLTGKYNDGMPTGTRMSLPGYEWLRQEFESPTWQAGLEKVRRLTPIAGELGCSMAQMALAWCLKNPNVSTVITGASRAEQVRENIKALDVAGQITDEMMGRIDAILVNKPQQEQDQRA